VLTVSAEAEPNSCSATWATRAADQGKDRVADEKPQFTRKFSDFARTLPILWVTVLLTSGGVASSVKGFLPGKPD